ncbi:MAG TPA: DUF2007 domain-containing protein [Flavobacteriia bacterium]|jgi:DNA-directed RNA polymerase subunit RPC12/RpoP|nr:DUF2007 domain-containing protein [Flavobacteriia bacterium]
MNESFKTVAVFQYSSEAQIIKAYLESEGIQVFMVDNFTIDIDPLFSNTIGGVKLKVLSKQENKALELLSSIKKYSLNDDGKAIHCPNCNSKKVQLLTTVRDIKSFLWFVFGLLSAILPPYVKYTYKCQDCNTEFNQK